MTTIGRKDHNDMVSLHETCVSHGRHDVDIHWPRRSDRNNVNPKFYGFCALFKESGD